MTNLQATLHTVIQLAATMPDPHAMILGIRAADPSRLGHGGASDGLPFRLDTTLDFWDTAPGDVHGIRTRTGVHDWAATWAYSWWEWADDSSPKPSGDMLQWLASRLAWAERCYPAMEEFAEELAHVQRILEHAHGLDPIPTDRTCPSCGGQLQHKVTSKGVSPEYDCRDCENQYSPDGLELMTDTRIKESDQWIPRDIAAKLLGVSRHRIRVWINRGQLEDRDGRISVSQARTLMRVALRYT
jgi:hypothetical protein